MIVCVCVFGVCVCVSYISELQLLSIVDALHLGVSLRADVVVVGVCGHQQHVCNTGQHSSQHLTQETSSDFTNVPSKNTKTNHEQYSPI